MHTVCADVSQEGQCWNSCVACHVPLSSSTVQARVQKKCVAILPPHGWVGSQKSIELKLPLHVHV